MLAPQDTIAECVGRKAGGRGARCSDGTSAGWERSRPLAAYLFFSSRRLHTRCSRDWSSDVCSSDLLCSVTTGISWVVAGVCRCGSYFCALVVLVTRPA